MHTKTIAHQFGISSRVLEKNLDGVSHQESLINPQPGGSCLNWLLGHLTRSRNQALPLRPEADVSERGVRHLRRQRGEALPA